VTYAVVQSEGITFEVLEVIMTKNDLCIEALAVSHSLTSQNDGSASIPGQSFTSFSVKRADGKPFTIDEAKLAALMMHQEVKRLTVIDATARGAISQDAAASALAKYNKGIEGVVHNLQTKVGIIQVETEKREVERTETPKTEKVEKNPPTPPTPPTSTNKSSEPTQKSSVEDPKSEPNSVALYVMPSGAQPTTEPKEAIKAWISYHAMYASLATNKEEREREQALAVSHLKKLRDVVGKEVYEQVKAEQQETQKKKPQNESETQPVPVSNNQTEKQSVPPGVGETLSAEEFIAK